MSAKPLAPGDTVWLTPRTVGCPGICHTEPPVDIVTVPRPGTAPIFLVRLPDGSEIDMHEDNIRRTQPPERRPAKQRPLPGHRPLKYSDDVIEAALW